MIDPNVLDWEGDLAFVGIEDLPSYLKSSLVCSKETLQVIHELEGSGYEFVQIVTAGGEPAKILVRRKGA